MATFATSWTHRFGKMEQKTFRDFSPLIMILQGSWNYNPSFIVLEEGSRIFKLETSIYLLRPRPILPVLGSSLSNYFQIVLLLHIHILVSLQRRFSVFNMNLGKEKNIVSKYLACLANLLIIIFIERQKWKKRNWNCSSIISPLFLFSDYYIEGRKTCFSLT